MQLKEFMKKERYNTRTFAEKANVHQMTMVKLLKGNNVNFSTMVKIHIATQGQVSFEELAIELKELPQEDKDYLAEVLKNRR